MKTKEAIEKVKDKYEGWQGYARSQKEFDELGKEREEVIALLKQGKKFKKIFQELEKWFNSIYDYNIGLRDILDKIEELKQKHFPEDKVTKE